MKTALLILILISSTGCTLTPLQRKRLAYTFCLQGGGKWDFKRNRCIEPRRIECKRKYNDTVICTELF